MKKIFIVISIIAGLVSITAVSLLYNQEIRLGLGMMTSDEKPQPTQIPDPICFVIDRPTSGEKGGTVTQDICFPLSDLETLGCDRLMLEYIYKNTNLLDEKEAIVNLRNAIGLPEGLSEMEYEKCADVIYQKRRILSEQNNVEPITDISDIITATNVVDANNQFTFNVYSKILQHNDENVFFSPWSISTAFAIAYEGARGNTAQEIQNTFGFIENDAKRRTDFQNIMEKSNEKNSEYKFSIANALWLAEGFEPHSEYVSAIQTHYDGDVSTVNFAADASSTINNWVSDKTEEKIKVLFDPGSLEPDTRLVITNAIYFNGSWSIPFDEKDTRQDEFIVSPEKTVQVQMMHQTAYFDYYQDKQLQLVELPYRGDKMSMLILIPTDVNGMDSLEDSLSAENIAKWQNRLENNKITVEIPKFTLETGYDLIEILQAMGVHDAFGSSADFTGISDEDLFIYKAIHKAVVDVNEVGTEAAAATGIAMLQSGPVATFRADHPFVFLIQDNENQNILFIGKVANPSE